MRPSVLGTRPEKRLLERSSVCSLGSAPSSGGSRPVMLLFCSSLKTTGAKRVSREQEPQRRTDGRMDGFVALG